MGDNRPDITEQKLTFMKHRTNNISDRIENFQKMTEGGMCLLGSGRCGFHNMKLLRNVQTKRMSVRGENDCVLRWEEKEVTTLVCQQRIERLCDFEVSPSDSAGKTNYPKKTKMSESLRLLYWAGGRTRCYY